MYGALVGDLQQLRARGVIERTRELDDALDAIDAALPGFALAAIDGVDLFVAQIDADALERKLLRLRVEADGHRRARAERRGQQVVGRRPGVSAPGGGRLVGGEPVRADRDL